MFPDDYKLASGRTAKAMLESSSPEFGSDGYSARGTPEAPSPEEPEIRLTKYVKWSIPKDGDSTTVSTTTDGKTSVRQAVSQEIPPDLETLHLKKSLSSRIRRHSQRNSNFEITAAVDKGARLSDSDSDEKDQWLMSSLYSNQSINSLRPEKTKDRDLKSPFGAEWYPEENSPYPNSEASIEDLDEEQNELLNHYKEIKYIRGGAGKNSKVDMSGISNRSESHKISDIDKVVRKHSVRSSTDRSALQILGTAGLPGNDSAFIRGKDTREGFTLSPLPTDKQLQAAKRANKGRLTDSDCGYTESAFDSGYSDMMACPPGVVDSWTERANANPCSEFDELQPRFAWLRRSVAPFTALAGAILVSVASM